MISIISAVSQNGYIGLNGDMPWGRELKSDLKHFKNLTKDNIVVMGRKTYESIGAPLPNRTNIIMTNSVLNAPASAVEGGCFVATKPERVLSIQNLVRSDVEIFIIGGAQIYEAFLPYADRIYLTKVLADVEGDTKFPEITGNWSVIEEKPIHYEDEPYATQHVTYLRRRD